MSTPSGKERPPLAGHNGPIGALAFAPNGHTLASAGWMGDGYMTVWDTATGEPLPQFNGFRPATGPGHMGVANTLAYSPSGATLVCGGGDNTAYFCDSATGKCLGQLMIGRTNGNVPNRDEYPMLGALSLAFSPDGKTLAIGGTDHAIRLWDNFSGKDHVFKDEG